jgi:ABC-type multidrug transport system ATPase subunit
MVLMDEPTSGLDALTAYECIYVAKALASMGTTVLCTIHQPSSRIFQLFDEVLVLGRGQIIYHGSVARSLDYFASLGHECPNYYNPADHIS